jgi:hypothetical protein
MSWRPQFVFSTPPGYRDEEFIYYFDRTNTPSLAAGATQDIGLTLQQDQPFVWRAWEIQNGAAATFNAFTGVLDGVRWKDPYGNYLSFGFVPTALYTRASSGLPFLATGGLTPSAPFTQGLVVPIEPEIFCPAGAVITLYANPSVALATQGWQVALYGVKRFPLHGEECFV